MKPGDISDERWDIIKRYETIRRRGVSYFNTANKKILFLQHHFQEASDRLESLWKAIRLVLENVIIYL